MKRTDGVAFLTFLFFTGNVNAINMDWIIDDNIYVKTTCNFGEDILLPETPYRYGYTFQGWFGYTPVEYLQSSGTQYIDTGIKGTSVSKVNITIQITSGFIGRDQKLFGFSETNGDTGSMFFTTFNGYYRGTSIPVTASKTNIELVRTDIVAKLSKATVSYDNEYFTTNRYWDAGMGTVDMFPIFAAISGSSGIQKAVYRCYGLKLYDMRGQLMRDMIPVLDMNNVACMYDKVTKQCFYNSGTGDFIIGAVITE